MLSCIAGTATEVDFGDVTNQLDSDDLHELFYALDIKKHCFDKDEKNADSTHPDLKAKEVLISWRNHEGHNATRQALLDALEKAKNIEAKETLEDMWNGNSKEIIVCFKTFIVIILW